MTINRPDLVYDDKKHTYTLDGVKLDGVSTVAKVGDDEVWPIASAWAFRIGYEGAVDVFNEAHEWYPWQPDEMRETLKQRKKTPWHKTDDAKERGTAVHDALEYLAQKNDVPRLENFPEDQRGYVQALCRWYLEYRPEFVATEVQVVSVEHKFAGRYDVRANIELDGGEEIDGEPVDTLCLIDLKTSKGVYPTTHFPQLAGYELASVEMGFPASDAQFVLNCKADGTFDFKRSNAEAEHFLAFLSAHRAIVDLKQKNKPPKKEKK